MKSTKGIDVLFAPNMFVDFFLQIFLSF